MIYTIRNESLTVSASTTGAELQSILGADGTEYLWQGDPKYWRGRSPNLFPYVARLNQGIYTLEGKTYSMPIHGFAPKAEFTLEAQTGDSMTFLLESTPERLEMYPFPFRYHLCYKLDGSTLRAEITVENLGEKTMYFGLGGHPGFNVPLEKGLAFEDYALEFGPCQPRRIGFDEACMVTGDTPYDMPENRIPLRHDLFDDDAIVLKDAAMPVTLRSPKGTHGVTVTAPDMGYIGFWHKPKTDAPYVCIEPWKSLPSRAGIIEDLATQPDLVHLPAGRSYKTCWTAECF